MEGEEQRKKEKGRENESGDGESEREDEDECAHDGVERDAVALSEVVVEDAAWNDEVET